MKVSTQTYTTPNFQGYSRQIQKQIDRVLIEPDNKNLRIQLAKSIKNGIHTILTPEKFIGEGSHNKVYKITRKYAARVPRKTEIDASLLPEQVSLGKKIFSGLCNYFGEAIVELDKFQILTNIGQHRPAGVPEHLSKIFSKNKINKYYLNKYLPRFAHIPQSAYDILAKDINKLNEIILGPRHFCQFDSINPNNIVAHRGNLYLVDEIDTLCDRSYSNTTAKLLEVFINRATKDMDAPDAGIKLPLVRKIFRKVILASSRANLLHANSRWDFMNWEKALKKCHIDNNASDVIAKLEEIDSKFPQPDLKDKKLKAYLDNLFIANPLFR